MDRLYVNELESYKMTSAEERKWIFKLEQNYYDFEKVKNEGIRKKLKEFILYKAENTSALAMYHYVFLYNRICEFFNKEDIEFDSYKAGKEEILEKYKAYLLKNGEVLFKEYVLRHDNKAHVYKPHSFYFLNQFLRFVYKEKYDEYILYIDDFPGINNNPVNPVRSLNLWKIRQREIRDEVKEAIIFSASYKAARTLQGEISAVNVFSKFIEEKYPEVKSCKDIRKDHISDYIVHLKIESGYKAKTYCNHIGRLKSVFIEVGQIYEYGKFETYFSYYEYMKKRQAIERAYTRYELQRFNKALKTIDEQLARCLLLHQLLGTRISDALLLESDCLIYKDGKPVIRIRQSKVDRFMEKPINNEIVKLIEKSIEYTKNQYGERKYIFVSSKNPDLPLKYNSLKYQTEEMIRINKLKDDLGDPLFFSTHAFRRAYGKRLTELHIDDVTIAKLLGHSDTQTVYRYRRMGNKQIAHETRPFRKYMDKIIEEISAEW